MKLLTENEIGLIACEYAGQSQKNRPQIAWVLFDVKEAYKKGYTQAQQDLLSQAMEGFEEKFGEEPKDGDSWDWANRKVGWQAAKLSSAKEIEALTKEKDAWKTMYLELRNRVAGAQQ